jgi:hypothetical protein
MCLEFIFGLKKIVVYFLFPVVTWTKVKRAVDVGGHKVVGGIPAEHHGDGRLGVIPALFGVLHSPLEDDFFGPWIVRQIRFVIVPNVFRWHPLQLLLHSVKKIVYLLMRQGRPSPLD